MIEQQGQVVSATERRISVRLGGQPGCAACEQGRGCGAGIFGRLLRRRPVSLDFDNEVGAAVGQAVIVGLPEALFLRLAARFYLYPILGGLGGAVIGHYLSGIAGLGGGPRDVAALLAGALAAGAALLVARRGETEFSSGSGVCLLRAAGDG